MPEFRHISTPPAPIPGLVLRIEGDSSRHLRITHVFDDGIYAMWVGEAENVRYAKRPQFLGWTDVDELASSPGAAWGRIVLPPQLSNPPEPESLDARKLNSSWTLIEPLIKSFERKANLSRQHFTALIRDHATRTSVAQRTLLRLVLRYYYFGNSRYALQPFAPGPQPGENSYPSAPATAPAEGTAPKRRGRQSVLSDELGPNQYVVSQTDIEGMVNCYKRLLRRGPTNKTAAHEEYLATEFRARHPELYQQYIDGRALEPVTYRQFTYYLNVELELTEDLARNERCHRRSPGNLNSLHSAGPGELYEIDSTGGRLFLVSADKEPKIVGKPTIYLLVDRWSRFVVSAYISLRAPSYEEVRNTLLVAFTSREARFARLGIDVSDERWPVGRVPAVICPDRGSDFMSKSMEQSVVNDLRIDLAPLPPLCPDGKAIVERLIRTIKQRMAASGLKGVYADRPLDPVSKRAARKAEGAAVHTLADAYRALVEIICDHNNRPHPALRRRRTLTLNAIEPTPRNAYLWGLSHITGLRSAPFSDEDYQRMLLSSDKASISDGVLRYKRRAYLPANEVAIELVRRSPRKTSAVDVRLDKTVPTEILISRKHGGWAKFLMTGGDAKDIEGISLDEEEAFSDSTARLWARAELKGRRVRVAAKSTRKNTPRRGTAPPTRVSKSDQQDARYRETAKLKSRLHATRPVELDSEVPEPKSRMKWVEVEKEERARMLDEIKKQRKKK